jgi:N-acetylglutamate synthase
VVLGPAGKQAEVSSRHRPTHATIHSVGLVGDVLERAARATPAAVEDRRTGWWLRHTDNGTWWSGAALAHGAADGLARRIEAAERFYAEHDALARFQVCADCPDGLDRSLAGRGYRRKAPISLLTAVADVRAESRARPAISACVDTSPGPDWLAVLRATSGPGTDIEHETRLLRQVTPPHAYVTVLADDEPVGIGRAVADAGWAGAFTMVTIPEARRRGVGRLVLSAIARWARANDAPRLYLQVERSNDAARRFYDALGFTRLATYHYRVQSATCTTVGRV